MYPFKVSKGCHEVFVGSPCVLATLETDEPTMHITLYQAIAAIEQSRMTSVNAHEEIAIAEAGLERLIGERTSRYS
jgi:hypothetical protein